jgi:hypothetical protein
MTSSTALAALRDLRKTDPDLLAELLGDTIEPLTISEAEPPYSLAEVDDPSDIPIDTILQHVSSGSQDVGKGFIVEEDKSVVRTAAGEDPDIEFVVAKVDDSIRMDIDDELQVAPVSLGRGHRKKKGTKPFGGTGAWWEH